MKNLRAKKAKYNKGRNHLERGFSMMEFLVSNSIMLVVIGIGFSLLNSGQRSFNEQSSSISAQARARKVLNLMVADLRPAGCSPTTITSGTTPGIVTASGNQIRIVADRSGNGITNTISSDDANDDITYSFANGVVTRSAPNDPVALNRTATVIDNVNGLSIQYYDSSNNLITVGAGSLMSTSDLARVRKCQITVSVRVVENGQDKGVISTDTVLTFRNTQLDSY